jgi:phosphoenolpyruvate-protein kinase (PTS system EI component)
MSPAALLDYPIRAAARHRAGRRCADEPCRDRREGARCSDGRPDCERHRWLADPGDAIIVDGETGKCICAPSGSRTRLCSEKVKLRARRQAQYRALARPSKRSRKTASRSILMMNAGLLVDLPHLAEAGADGIGLFRTELQFMIAATTAAHQRAGISFLSLGASMPAKEKPVTFRTLDIGGDKVLPYLRSVEEENPRSAGARSGSRWIGRACCARRCARCSRLRRAAS